MDQTIFNKSRRDKFSMVFDIPKALKDKAKQVQQATCNNDLIAFTAESIQFAIYGTPVPKVNISEIDLPYAGQTHKHTSYTRPAYSPLTIGMAVDNRFLNYWLLWTWLNLWNDAQIGMFDNGIYNADTYNTSIEDYVTSFTVYGLDEYNNKVIAFYYKNIIITSLSEIEFSYRNTEEIGCTATFVFDQMTVEPLLPVC